MRKISKVGGEARGERERTPSHETSRFEWVVEEDEVVLREVFERRRPLRRGR